MSTERTYDERVRWHTVLDNYEPARDYASGNLEIWHARAADEWTPNDRPRTLVVCDAVQLKDAHKSVFLIDDRHSVEPWYVAGWNDRDEPKGDRIFLHAMPVNFNADGTQRVSPKDGRPIDFDTWILGPRRAWHLKIDQRINGGA